MDRALAEGALDPPLTCQMHSSWVRPSLEGLSPHLRQMLRPRASLPAASWACFRPLGPLSVHQLRVPPTARTAPARRALGPGARAAPSYLP